MFKRFYPLMYEKSIYDINYDKLRADGVYFLLFDLDNTIAPYDAPEPDEKAVVFFAGLKKRGFKICLISNNDAARVDRFNKNLGLYAMPKAGKPNTRGVFAALSIMGGKTGGNAKSAALIGDQLLTDIWCGNRAGLLTILVDKASDRDEWTVCLKKPVEKFLYKMYINGGQKVGGQRTDKRKR